MMRLRPFDTARDLDRCLAIWRAASEVGHPFLDAATLDADATIVRTRYMPAAAITVAESAGRVVGFVALLGDHVGGLFVDPAAHRAGAGRALVADALARMGRLTVEVYAANTGARAFYAACGFTETGGRAMDDLGRALPLVRMAAPGSGSWPAGLSFLAGGSWLNPPPAWRLDGDALAIETGAETDFWRDTLYGFRRDTGHALLVPVHGDFTAHVSFEGGYEALYDQAGLMLRRDDAFWLKAGVEFSDGVANLSVVVTRGGSDWSTTPIAAPVGPQRLRLTRLGGAVVVQVRDAANRWGLLRVAEFPADAALSVGPMACSPKRGGFRARFTEFRVGPAVSHPLHDENPVD
jgi:regulation of enolase protein 1 (concanavalin A-like superfamily)/GNAT superfamily N-acetyltransferase